MTGILIAALAALILSFGDFGKKIMTNHFDPLVVVWSTITIGSIANLIYLWITGFPAVNLVPWIPLLLLNIFVAYLSEIFFIRSISSGDFSLTFPFSAFAPIFSSIVGALGFNETPNFYALLGVVLVVLGGYLMFLDRTKPGWFLAPFRSLAVDAGPRNMILCSLTFSISTGFQRVLAPSLGAYYALVLLLLGIGLVLSFWLVFKKRDIFVAWREKPGLSFGTGIVWSLGITSLYLSMNYTLLAYATAVSRAEIILGVLWGYLFLKEADFTKRLTSALIMLAGVMIVIFASGNR